MKTTDNQQEIFDVVDEDDNVIGKTTRGETYKNKNLIHRSIYVAVFNSKGELFMQQRSATKDTDPLCWDISSSGHVRASGNYDDAAKRELEEELGVDLDLNFIDKFIIYYPHETEMVSLYRAHSDGPFKLHPQEIKSGRFINKDTLSKEYKMGFIKLSFGARVVLQKLNWI